MDKRVTPPRATRSRQIFASSRYTVRREPIMSSRQKKSPTPSAPETSAPSAPAARARVPRRLWVFAALDVLFAALYIGVVRLVHSSDGRFEAMTVVMGVAVLAAGIGLAVR